MISVARILRTSQLTFIISNLAIYFLEQMKSPHSQSQNQKSQINNNSQRSRLFACLWLYSTSRLVTMAYNENKNNRRNHIFFTPFFMPSYFSSSSAKPVHHQTTTSNLIAVILHFFSIFLSFSGRLERLQPGQKTSQEIGSRLAHCYWRRWWDGLFRARTPQDSHTPRVFSTAAKTSKHSNKLLLLFQRMMMSSPLWQMQGRWKEPVLPPPLPSPVITEQIISKHDCDEYSDPQTQSVSQSVSQSANHVVIKSWVISLIHWEKGKKRQNKIYFSFKTSAANWGFWSWQEWKGNCVWHNKKWM